MQLARLALQQFDLDFVQRRALASGADLPGVEAKRRARAVGECQRLRGTVDLGHEDRTQPPRSRLEHAAPGCGRQLAGVDARRAHRPFIFGSPMQCANPISGTLHGLQPAVPVPAHAQRDPGLAQFPGAGVVVGADVLGGAGATAEHRGEGRMLTHPPQRGRVYRQLEFDFRCHDCVGFPGR